MKKFSTFSGKLEGNPRGSLFKLDPPEAALQKKQLSSDSRKYTAGTG
jgi:hypothetical protein